MDKCSFEKHLHAIGLHFSIFFTWNLLAQRSGQWLERGPQALARAEIGDGATGDPTETGDRDRGCGGADLDQTLGREDEGGK